MELCTYINNILTESYSKWKVVPRDEARDIAVSAITAARKRGDADLYESQYGQLITSTAELWLVQKDTTLNLFPLTLLHGKPWALRVDVNVLVWEQTTQEVSYYYIPRNVVRGGRVIPVDCEQGKTLYMSPPVRDANGLYLKRDNDFTYRLCDICHQPTRFHVSQVLYYKKRNLGLPGLCKACAARVGSDLYKPRRESIETYNTSD